MVGAAITFWSAATSRICPAAATKSAPWPSQTVIGSPAVVLPVSPERRLCARGLSMCSSWPAAQIMRLCAVRRLASGGPRASCCAVRASPGPRA